MIYARGASGLIAKSCLTLAISWTVARQAPLSLGSPVLKWIAISSCRGSSQPRNRTQVSCTSCIAGRFFTLSHQGNLPLIQDPPIPRLLPSPVRFPGRWISYDLCCELVLENRRSEDQERLELDCLLALHQKRIPYKWSKEFLLYFATH